MSNIAIGPSYFKRELRDYANWRWAVIREILQNSIDSKASSVSVKIALVDGNTVLDVVNDGEVMSREVITSRLLSLGESGKNFADGAVGGFGKAKVILYFTHENYEIHSGDLVVSGSGSRYEISESPEFLSGTRSVITIAGDHVSDLVSACRKFASFAQWSGSLSLTVGDSCERLSCSLAKGSRRRDLDFGVVYTNLSMRNCVVVRVNGIPMFTYWCSVDRCVVVELFGPSCDYLTSNRDGLVDPFRSQLSDFITSLSVDNVSALKKVNPEYELFDGRLLSGVASKSSSNSTDIPVYRDSDSLLVASFKNVKDPVSVSVDPVVSVQNNAGMRFFLKNETTLAIPSYYRPDNGGFSGYSKKLIVSWASVLRELHVLFEHCSVFSVGFLFSEDAEAQFESGGRGLIYFVNPAKVVEQSSTHSRSLKKRWKFDNAGKKMLLSVAVHEFVHGLGYMLHCESFAQKYTEIVGHVLANVQRFNRCFE